MNITLAQFQLKAIGDLLGAMESDKREIVLKSCTGSGKTIILTHFMDEYCRGNAKTVFVWLTPGKGNLEEQSREKMNRYIHASQTKRLADVMTGGFEENDACFINWEKLTKKGNNALKESERTNFLEHIEKALNNGLKFVVIVDESHQNDTLKADDILKYFRTDKIIRCSATPKGFSNAEFIDIPEEDVIAEGLIKKVLIINENFPRLIRTANQTYYLLEKALAKQRELHASFLEREREINPLIVIQIPNRSELLQGEVERWFEEQGITYENGRLAVWLSDRKQNLDGIEEPNAAPIAVIIKQAVATGWDCPRAHILVKLRDNMDETFEIQTIGRIRRMPEAKHYESPLLDSCYLYTFDEKFSDGVRLSLGKGALDARILRLKDTVRKIALTSEQRPGISVRQDGQTAMVALRSYFVTTYHLDGKRQNNQKQLAAYGYVFQENVVRRAYMGEMRTMTRSEVKDLNHITVSEPLSTHRHGREFHHRLSEIALKIGLEYSQLSTIVQKLFAENAGYYKRILSLKTREVYAFILNNTDLLKEDVRRAMAGNGLCQSTAVSVLEVPFTFPQTSLFTYDASAKTQEIMDKNVYAEYLSSAEIRSDPERKFERFCEECADVLWVYKNGDKGAEFLSLIYSDAFGKPKAFFPDYVLGTTSGIWILETKGGFTRTGQSEDIDRFSARKFEVLKNYVRKYNLHGGIVREDGQTLELCVCTDTYSEDVKSENWQLLRNALKTEKLKNF